MSIRFRVGALAVLALLAAISPPPAPARPAGPLAGFEPAPPGLKYHVPKPPYAYEVRKDYGEAVFVLRVYSNREGAVVRAEPVAFVGDRRILSQTIAYALAHWTVGGRELRPYYKDVPVTFRLESASSWAQPVVAKMEQLRGADRVRAFLAAIAEVRRAKGESPRTRRPKAVEVSAAPTEGRDPVRFRSSKR